MAEPAATSLHAKPRAEQAPGPINRAFRDDVLAGLSQRQKAIPARWFYDDLGSRLFEEITCLPEYYLTRAETEILMTRGGEFAMLIGAGRAVVEFGSGSSRKTPHLLRAIAPAAYVPIDIAGDFLRQSAEELSAGFPGLPILPVEADFTATVILPEQVRPLAKLGFFPGSTIGNQAPFGAVDLLRSMRRTLGEGSLLLIGMDLVKDPQVLRAAYDDAAGITARFNRNLIDRINRELAGDLPSDSLRHRAIWSDRLARIEMHLEATRDLAFAVQGQNFVMRAGETIHTENSHKYDGRSAAMLLLAGGWSPQAEWQDQGGCFSLVLAQASETSIAP